jgi:alpha-L-rhamnosidase
MHLSTGFVGAPYLAHVLSHNGRLDTAYALLFQKSWPSWLYAVTQGATTVWERWDGWTEENGFQDTIMNSFNHYAYGAIGDWLYSVVAGIEVDFDAPGYKRIIIQPQPGGGLTYAQASLDSLYGRVDAKWMLEDDDFQLIVTIPPNTEGVIRLSGQSIDGITEQGQNLGQLKGVRRIQQKDETVILTVGSGYYHFKAKVHTLEIK